MTTITTPQVCQIFGVSHVAVSNWRKGSATRAALPVAKPPKGASPRSIFFDSGKVLAWAKKHKVAVAVDATTLAGITASTAEPVKPGPKVVAEAKPAAKTTKAPAKTARKAVAKDPVAKAKAPAKKAT